ncbi:DUF1850 domain-containing protein [Halomonas sp. PA5]|nr:DUF1850 domain-containing protein [Halomonas sp. PA5]
MSRRHQSLQQRQVGRAWWLALLLCCLALSPLSSQAEERAKDPTVLEVIDAYGERLFSLPLVEDDGWCLGWNHSVAKFTVLDCYRFREGRMWLERSHQPDFAAGLGHTEGRGEQISDGQGGYWIVDIDEPVPGSRYVLRVGSAAVDHRLIWDSPEGQRQASLSDIAAGQRVTLQLHKPDDV